MKIRRFAFMSTIVVMLSWGLGACRSAKEGDKSLSYYNFTPSLVSSDSSGKLTVRAWGHGPSKGKALEQARKNAVTHLLFSGYQGATGILSRPLVTEVNARERYSDYFDRFFADGGEYRKFVKEASGSDGSRTKSESDSRKNYGAIFVLDRNGVASQLRSDGIIK